MEKYLVNIEFRYSDSPETEDHYTGRRETVTIGVYDTFDEACESGNNLLEKLESKFGIKQYPNGTKVRKERFSKNGNPFGGKNTLVTGLHVKTPFLFFARIETLKFDDVDKSIDDVMASLERYRNYMADLRD